MHVQQLRRLIRSPHEEMHTPLALRDAGPRAARPVHGFAFARPQLAAGSGRWRRLHPAAGARLAGLGAALGFQDLLPERRGRHPAPHLQEYWRHQPVVCRGVVSACMLACDGLHASMLGFPA